MNLESVKEWREHHPNVIIINDGVNVIDWLISELERTQLQRDALNERLNSIINFVNFRE